MVPQQVLDAAMQGPVSTAQPAQSSAAVPPAQPYGALAPLNAAPPKASVVYGRSESYYDAEKRVQSWFGPSGIGYHLPVAALAGVVRSP